MSTGQPHSRHQQGIIKRYYEHLDTIALQRLGELVSDLYLAEGVRAKRMWDSAAAALRKVAEDEPEVARILAQKDIPGLARLLTELGAARRPAAGGARAAADAAALDRIVGNPATIPALSAVPCAGAAAPGAGSPALAPTAEQLKAAMKAFRKRIKLTRLDEESRLGRNPMSAGKKSSVVAIMAPREYPPAVWEELVRQGRLKHAGGSFYELTEG